MLNTFVIRVCVCVSLPLCANVPAAVNLLGVTSSRLVKSGFRRSRNHALCHTYNLFETHDNRALFTMRNVTSFRKAKTY